MKIIEEVSKGNYNKSVLENGLTIVSEFVPEIGSFSAGICINVGSRNDIKSKEGIAHFMEHAAFRHTKNRTSKQIANEFETLGAYSNAFTTKELTCFYVRAIKEHFAKTFEILSDITLNTIFVEQEIEKEKLIIIEEIKSYEDDPEEYICDLADTLVFAGSSLAPPIVGTQNSVSNISFGDLEKFHKNYYCPANITISVAGNILHNDIVALTKKYFNSNSKWKKANNNFFF
jgi:predicted Zn-dependent peptidase